MGHITSLLGWGALIESIGLYLLAAAMIAGGAYLAVLFNMPATNPLFWLLRPIRFIGYGLIGAGLVLGAFTFGLSSGASKCEAAWRAKNLEAQIERLVQERNAKTVAAAEAESSLKAIASQKEDADAQVSDYRAATMRFADALAACRRATDDDDRRMCAIVGSAAPGCGNPR